jgi:hypothetical protein
MLHKYMPDNEIKPIEGELVKAEETITEEIREAGKRGGVFIGTLNIMAEPAKAYLTEPIANAYKTNYEKKFKNPLAVFLFDAGLVILGAIAAAAAIYFAFFFKVYEPVKLSLAVLPNEPVSGGEVIIKADVQNNTADAISADLPLRFPKTISIKTSSVAFDRTTGTVHFDSIDPGATAEARLVADLAGEIGQKQKISGILSYADSSTNVKGKTSAGTTFSISRSLFTVAFEFPDRIIVGQRFSGQIRYANKGGKDANDLYLTINWPAGFVLNSSDIPAKDGRFALGTVKANAEGTLGWSGTLTDASSGTDFSAELDAKDQNDYIEQATASGTTTVVDPKISLIISGASAGRPGDLIPYSLEYRNDGDQTLSDVSLSLISTDGITSEKLNAAGSTLAPGDDLKTTAQIRLPQTLPNAIATQNNPTLGFNIVIKGKLGTDDVMISSPEWNVKIASALGITATARYWSETGDQLGRGPMPPKVGQTTKYWIFWNVTNTTNSVDNVSVAATLPANITYTGKATVSAGDAIIFDPTTRNVTWNAGSVTPFPGSATDAFGAGFEVALTPTASQSGTYPALLSNVKITGSDSFAGLTLTASAPDVTAKLANDNKAAGTGPVR